MRIKVCGLTIVDQFLQLDKLGIELGGFIFYPKSPRYVFNHLNAKDIKNLKGESINKVGVFVNETIEDVLKIVDDCGISIVQLHGDETPHYCEKIAEYVTVIKAFRLRDEDDVFWKIKDYQDVADMFLFDTATAGYGGSGQLFDWNILKGLSFNKPFLLSGGIGIDDLDKINHFIQDNVSDNLFALDINSKFEIKPGVKNIELIEKFIAQSVNLKSSIKETNK
jgi:phosphoribosylanthranilate isomerase